MFVCSAIEPQSARYQADWYPNAHLNKKELQVFIQQFDPNLWLSCIPKTRKQGSLGYVKNRALHLALPNEMNVRWELKIMHNFRRRLRPLS